MDHNIIRYIVDHGVLYTKINQSGLKYLDDDIMRDICFKKKLLFKIGCAHIVNHGYFN